jgi:MoaA/NifB/PqqE/SkfB family radical SAM enzyme
MPGSKPGEIVLYTEVTTSCSHHCDFCPIHLVERRGNIQPDVQRGVLNLISSHPGRKFVVYPHLVGEPLLFPGLREYLRALVALPNVELWLCTNGAFLDESRLQELVDSGLRNIWYSMFYATPADYRKHTGSDHFEAARRNLHFLLKQSSKFDKIHVVLFSQATEELEALIREKSNVTLQIGRDVHPWQGEGRLYKRKIFRFLFSTMGKFRTKYICVSIDGKVGFDWRDYNLRNSLGDIRDLDPSRIMRRIDASDFVNRRDGAL